MGERGWGVRGRAIRPAPPTVPPICATIPLLPEKPGACWRTPPDLTAYCLPGGGISGGLVLPDRPVPGALPRPGTDSEGLQLPAVGTVQSAGAGLNARRQLPPPRHQRPQILSHLELLRPQGQSPLPQGLDVLE